MARRTMDRRSIEILYWQRQASKRNKPGRSRDEARAMVRELTAAITPRKRV